MSIPRKVKEAEELADRLMAQAYAPKDEAANEAPEGTEQAKPTAISAPPTGSDETPLETKADEAEKPPKTEAKPEEDSWEHRYKVLSGKYSSEVPRFAAELREAKAKLDQREAELEKLKKQPKQREKLVKQEEIDEYGENFLDMVRRAAQEVVADKESEIEALREEMAVIKANSAKSAEADFYSRLADQVPDWVTINDDGDFHRWLSEPDELTGTERQVLLADAEAKRNANRVARFFIKWKEARKEREASVRQSLNAQVAPSSTPSQDVPPAKRYWTRRDIEKVYGMMRSGEMSDEEFAALESDIHAAQMENRIR